jgi:hypothetical protein
MVASGIRRGRSGDETSAKDANGSTYERSWPSGVIASSIGTLMTHKNVWLISGTIGDGHLNRLDHDTDDDHADGDADHGAEPLGTSWANPLFRKKSLMTDAGKLVTIIMERTGSLSASSNHVFRGFRGQMPDSAQLEAHRAGIQHQSFAQLVPKSARKQSCDSQSGDLCGADK